MDAKELEELAKLDQINIFNLDKNNVYLIALNCSTIKEYSELGLRIKQGFERLGVDVVVVPDSLISKIYELKPELK